MVHLFGYGRRVRERTHPRSHQQAGACIEPTVFDSLPERPLISVCILAGHGVAALNECLASLQAQAGAPPFELLIGGNPSPQVRSILARRFPAAHVCDTEGRLPGAARNPLIERARGELLLFLDDDVTAPPDLLRLLAQTAATHPGASVFGGPNDTPLESSRFQAVQGAVLGSLVGAGPVSRRYGARHAGPADERWFTLCNLAVRRRAMMPFAQELVCAEENALLSQLRARGEKMRYEPRLRVFHARRPTLRSFAKQMFKYGRGRGQLVARRPQTVRAAYLAPTVLLLYLLLLPALVASSAPIGLALGPAAVYVALVAASAVRIGWTLRRPADIPRAAALILSVHFCYGAGVVRGLTSRSRRHEQPSPRWISTAHGAPVQPMAASDSAQSSSGSR